MVFAWQCPYCSRHATIGHHNVSRESHTFDINNKDGHSLLLTQVISCPNPSCREYEVTASLYDARRGLNGNLVRADEPRKEWKLRPESAARPMPEYVPAAVVADYTEACAILYLSPKASATLARRCLQGMIRDFFGVRKEKLLHEIHAIRDKVSEETWNSIEAVRKLGNIGAHMEKDINVIVDVDPDEAILLIQLIESLIEDWYVNRHERKLRYSRLQGVVADKNALKGGATTSVQADAKGPGLSDVP